MLQPNTIMLVWRRAMVAAANCNSNNKTALRRYTATSRWQRGTAKRQGQRRPLHHSLFLNTTTTNATHTYTQQASLLRRHLKLQSSSITSSRADDALEPITTSSRSSVNSNNYNSNSHLPTNASSRSSKHRTSSKYTTFAVGAAAAVAAAALCSVSRSTGDNNNTPVINTAFAKAATTRMPPMCPEGTHRKTFTDWNEGPTPPLPPRPGPPPSTAAHSQQQKTMKQRTIVVGDVHGCFAELLELLDTVQYHRDTDRLVFVGDLVGKGPNSIEVLRFVRQNNLECVRGNHEHMLLQWREIAIQWQQQQATCQANKHKEEALPYPIMWSKTHQECAEQMDADDWAWLESLPVWLHLDQKSSFFVVHAGIVPGVPLQEQDDIVMMNLRTLTNRERLQEPVVRQFLMTDARGVIVPSAPAPLPLWCGPKDEAITLWAQKYHGPMHIIFGHDAVAGVQQHAHATGLDSGACYGNGLTAIILPSRELVTVSSQPYCPMRKPSPSKQRKSDEATAQTKEKRKRNDASVTVAA